MKGSNEKPPRLSGTTPMEGKDEQSLNNKVELKKFQPTIEEDTCNTVNSKEVESFNDENSLKNTIQNSPPLEGWSETGVVKKVGFFMIKNHKIGQNKIIYLPYNSSLKEKARLLRKARNLPEVLFWEQVHKGLFYKIDFDRQRVIGNFIVDFYVKKLGLVVDIVSDSEEGTIEHNLLQDDYLKSLALRVFRISSSEILNNVGKVMLDLENYIINQYGEMNE